jgi:predicted amidophosphoribosyltransferase
MECSACQTIVREGSWFCTDCGIPVAHACSSCGGELEPDDRFCACCGRPVHAPEPSLHIEHTRSEGGLSL